MENYVNLFFKMLRVKYFNGVYFEAVKHLFTDNSQLQYAYYQISEEEVEEEKKEQYDTS